MKQLYYKRILMAPIQKGAITPNPGGPAIVWSTINSCLLLWSGTAWGSLTDPKLRALENLNTFGFVVRDPGSGNFVTRELAGTAGQIQIFNSNGETNPSIALTNTGVVPGTYTKITVDAQGRVKSGGALTVSDMPPDYLQMFRENNVDSAPSSVTGKNSISIGNGNNVANKNSIALGKQAVARQINSLVYSNGRFSSQGDSQVGKYILKTVTTNNFQREMYLDGPIGTTPLILPDHSTWMFKATIIAHQTDGPDLILDRAGWEIRGVVYKIAGAESIAFQGTPVVEVIGQSITAWTVSPVANTATGSLSFIVKAQSGKIIRWIAAIDTVEITN